MNIHSTTVHLSLLTSASHFREEKTLLVIIGLSSGHNCSFFPEGYKEILFHSQGRLPDIWTSSW